MTTFDLPNPDPLGADPFANAGGLPPSSGVPAAVSRQKILQRRSAVFALFGGALLGLLGTLVFYNTDMGLGVLVGILADSIYYNTGLGINVILFFGACALLLLFGARQMGIVVRRTNLLLIAAVLILSLLSALWLNESLILLNMIALFGFGGLAVFYFARSRPFTADGVGGYLIALIRATFSVALMPLSSMLTAFEAIVSFLQHGGMAKEASWRKPVFATVRGLLIAAPIVIVFTLLLASADAVFDKLLISLTQVFSLSFPRALEEQLIMTGVIAWFAAGGLACALAVKALPVEQAANSAGKPKPKRRIWIGSTEAITVLACVVALFAVFVVIQFAYFFGGQANLEAMTYAQYARRGFFELVAVSVLTLGLLLWLDAVSARPSPRTTLIFRLLATALVALTGVLLASAAGRMSLYELAYGFTHLRIGTHVFMAWLGVLFIVYLASLFRPRGATRVFAPGLLVVAFGYVFTLNLLGLDSIIARENLRRFEQGAELDFSYLNTLSLDAAPVIADFWLHTTDDLAREDAGMWLANHRAAYQPGFSDQSPFSANLSRARGLQLIAELPQPVPPANRRYTPNHVPDFWNYSPR